MVAVEGRERLRKTAAGTAGTVLTCGLIVIAGFMVTGAIPIGLISPPNTEWYPLSFHNASAASIQSSMKIPGGPWKVIGASGWAVGTTKIGGSETLPFLPPNCSVAWQSDQQVVLPGMPTSSAPGTAGYWEVFSENASGYVLGSIVTNSSLASAIPLEIASGVCTYFVEGLSGYTPSNPIDSSAAAAVADHAGGSGFLTTHQLETAWYNLVGVDWFITYSTCASTNFGGSGFQFEVAVNAVTAGIDLAGNVSAGECLGGLVIAP